MTWSTNFILHPSTPWNYAIECERRMMPICTATHRDNQPNASYEQIHSAVHAIAQLACGVEVPPRHHIYVSVTGHVQRNMPNSANDMLMVNINVRPDSDKV